MTAAAAHKTHWCVDCQIVPVSFPGRACRGCEDNVQEQFLCKTCKQDGIYTGPGMDGENCINCFGWTEDDWKAADPKPEVVSVYPERAPYTPPPAPRTRAPGERPICPVCKVNRSRYLGPECLNCYYGTTATWQDYKPSPRWNRVETPIPDAADEITYLPALTNS